MVQVLASIQGRNIEASLEKHCRTPHPDTRFKINKKINSNEHHLCDQRATSNGPLSWLSALLASTKRATVHAGRLAGIGCTWSTCFCQFNRLQVCLGRRCWLKVKFQQALRGSGHEHVPDMRPIRTHQDQPVTQGGSSFLACLKPGPSPTSMDSNSFSEPGLGSCTSLDWVIQR